MCARRWWVIDGSERGPFFSSTGAFMMTEEGAAARLIARGAATWKDDTAPSSESRRKTRMVAKVETLPRGFDYLARISGSVVVPPSVCGLFSARVSSEGSCHTAAVHTRFKVQLVEERPPTTDYTAVDDPLRTPEHVLNATADALARPHAPSLRQWVHGHALPMRTNRDEERHIPNRLHRTYRL